MVDAGKKMTLLDHGMGISDCFFKRHVCYFSLHIVSLDYQGSSVCSSLSFSLVIGLLLRILVIGRGY